MHILVLPCPSEKNRKQKFCTNVILYRQRGSKGDVVNVMVKIEFAEKVLGESPKVDCTPDTPAEFNFSATLNCTYEDPLALDEIAHKPVVCESFDFFQLACQYL